MAWYSAAPLGERIDRIDTACSTTTLNSAISAYLLALQINVVVHQLIKGDAKDPRDAHDQLDGRIVFARLDIDQVTMRGFQQGRQFAVT
jgi:hypothetical protein